MPTKYCGKNTAAAYIWVAAVDLWIGFLYNNLEYFG